MIQFRILVIQFWILVIEFQKLVIQFRISDGWFDGQLPVNRGYLFFELSELHGNKFIFVCFIICIH